MLRHRTRTCERSGPATDPGERASDRGRHAIGGDRRPRQSRAGCGIAVERCCQGARGRDSDHRGLGRHSPIGESDPRRASRFHQGLGSRHRRAKGAGRYCNCRTPATATASSVTSSACLPRSASTRRRTLYAFRPARCFAGGSSGRSTSSSAAGLASCRSRSRIATPPLPRS